MRHSATGSSPAVHREERPATSVIGTLERVQILAHRGLSTTPATDNTVAAVSHAFSAGADGVQVDLRLSADGVLVACHDPDLRRVAGSALEVGFTSWQRLRQAAELAGTPLARVEWVLAAAAGRPVVLELKPASLRTATALVERLLGLHAAGLPMDVTVSSFDASLVRAFRETVPRQLGTRTALLGRPGCLSLATLRQALAAGHDAVHLQVSDLLARPETVELAAARDVAVVPWTVNTRRTLQRCIDLGVAGVVTDRPRVARHVLRHQPVLV